MEDCEKAYRRWVDTLRADIRKKVIVADETILDALVGLVNVLEEQVRWLCRLLVLNFNDCLVL